MVMLRTLCFIRVMGAPHTKLTQAREAAANYEHQEELWDIAEDCRLSRVEHDIDRTSYLDSNLFAQLD